MTKEAIENIVYCRKRSLQCKNTGCSEVFPLSLYPVFVTNDIIFIPHFFQVDHVRIGKFAKKLFF